VETDWGDAYISYQHAMMAIPGHPMTAHCAEHNLCQHSLSTAGACKDSPLLPHQGSTGETSSTVTTCPSHTSALYLGIVWCVHTCSTAAGQGVSGSTGANTHHTVTTTRATTVNYRFHLLWLIFFLV